MAIGRWRHFSIEGVDRWAQIADRVKWPDSAARARAEFDLAIVSVLLDAGAGAVWRYQDKTSGQAIGRSARQGEAADATPLRPYELLDAIDHRDAVLRGHVLQLERLPPIRVDHRRARPGDDERWIDRLVAGIGVSARLVRAVGQSIRLHRRGDAIADRRG